MQFQPQMIAGYNAGLQKNKKPFLLIDSAFQTLENAYCWRERIKKRDGIKLVGRLRRVLTAQALGNTVGAQTTYNFANIFTILGITGENPQIEPGSVIVTIAAPDSATFTDNGDGTFAVTGSGVASGSYINYSTGELNLILMAAAGGAAITIDFNYFPGLPVMGIDNREQGAINDEQTIFFDTKYVYTYNGNTFSSPSTFEWSGVDADFFWMANYRGADPFNRLFFVTNFTNPVSSTNNRIRYTSDVATWTDFTPAVDSVNSIYQAKLIISYYGRLLILNTYEGAFTGMPPVLNVNNYYARCRFSQIGNPLEADAFRSDIFGKGGFIDAPTTQAIVSARFYKNTLIVFFERSTWELRYVGEYGLPFIWERISSDFGSESTFSTVLFDQGILAVGDKAIVTSSGNTVQRIDLDIPDQVFTFHNKQEGKERVHGERDFQKQLVFWCYSDGGIARKFPNRVLVYNYINNTWAIFRDNVTAFGTMTQASGDSWDLPISWNSATSWDEIYQGGFPTVICGNQQGFVHYYNFVLDPETTPDNEIPFIEHESLYISSITRNTSDNLRITVPNHNLETGEIVYINGLSFIDTSNSSVLPTTLNERFYSVIRVGSNELDLNQYDIETDDYLNTSFDEIGYSPAPGTGTYVGGGVLALFPKVNIVTKDFNPYQDKGSQMKSSYTDFQMDSTPNSGVTINLYVNSSFSESANLPIYNPTLKNSTGQWGYITNITQGNPAVVTSPNHGLTNGRNLTIGYVFGMTEVNGQFYSVIVIDNNTFSLDVDSSAFTVYTRGGKWWTTDFNPFYVSGSAYAYFRFYSNIFGQYITYQITYDDLLMNDPTTHDGTFELNAMILYTKPAGRLVL